MENSLARTGKGKMFPPQIGDFMVRREKCKYH
jgi:hypothetical protein